MPNQPHFWRIIVTGDGVEIASGQGIEPTAKDAAYILSLWLHEFAVHRFPTANGHVIEIKTIFEKVATMDDDTTDNSKDRLGHA